MHGQKFCIVAPMCSGKTTLVRAFQRLFTDVDAFRPLSVAYNLASVVEGDGPTPHPIAKVKLPRTDTNTNK